MAVKSAENRATINLLKLAPRWANRDIPLYPSFSTLIKAFQTLYGDGNRVAENISSLVKIYQLKKIRIQVIIVILFSVFPLTDLLSRLSIPAVSFFNISIYCTSLSSEYQ